MNPNKYNDKIIKKFFFTESQDNHFKILIIPSLPILPLP